MIFSEGHILREFRENETLLVQVDLRYPQAELAEGEDKNKGKRKKESPEGVLFRNTSRYFDALCGACTAYAEEKLYPAAKEEYAASPDPLKRFRFAPYMYTLRYEVTEKERITEMILMLSLVRRGQKCRILGEKKVIINWEKSIGMMLPINRHFIHDSDKNRGEMLSKPRRGL